MFADMKAEDGGLIEYLHEEEPKPMPPIRVGLSNFVSNENAVVWREGLQGGLRRALF
jgi:hypothetical protein